MIRTPGRTSKEKDNHWTKIIDEARKFPEGVAAYCTAKGIGKNNYYFWFKRLRTAHPEWNDLSKTPVQARKTKRHTQPETEVDAKPRRRKFSAKEKAGILKETEASSKGQVAAILRREGLYASQLHKWRLEKQRAEAVVGKGGGNGNPLTVRVNGLQAQCGQLEKQLKRANAIIDLQKKISEVLGVVMRESGGQ